MGNKVFQIVGLIVSFSCSSALIAKEWDMGAFVGGRTDYAPSAITAHVAEISFRTPLVKNNYFYHQFAVGFWQRKEQKNSRDPVVISPAVLAGIPVVTSYHASYSLGLKTQGDFYLNISHGVGLIDKTTVYLGTHYQFFTSLGFGFKTKQAGMECGFRHISNGSRYTGTTEVNMGEDFVLCGLIFSF